MATFTVRQGKRYRATIALGPVERLASNGVIEAKLREAGFAEITVTGSGGMRYAEVVWPGPDRTAEMPAQVASVTEVA